MRGLHSRPRIVLFAEQGKFLTKAACPHDLAAKNQSATTMKNGKRGMTLNI